MNANGEPDTLRGVSPVRRGGLCKPTVAIQQGDTCLPYVFAAAEIYTMIRDYPHNVTVRIASIAASAASVIAMAGNTVQMSPTALLMIHDPSTIAFGNAKDMEKAIATLNEVKESIINAYAAKTGLSRSRISKLMSDETWINAKKAVELGFADVILFDEKHEPDKKEDEPDKPDEPEKPDEEGGDDEGDEKEKDKKPFKLDTGDALWEYSTRVMGQTILGKITASAKNEGTDDTPDDKADTQKPSEKGGNCHRHGYACDRHGRKDRRRLYAV